MQGVKDELDLRNLPIDGDDDELVAPLMTAVSLQEEERAARSDTSAVPINTSNDKKG